MHTRSKTKASIGVKIAHMESIALGCNTMEQPAPTWTFQECVVNKKEADMGFNIDHAAVAKSHLRERLYQTNSQKDSKLRQMFGLRDDDAPRTPAALVARIQAGNFVLPKERENYDTYSPAEYIRWRSPDKMEDQAGFDAAWDTVEQKFVATMDTIEVLDPKDGLAALREFEAA